MRVAILGNSGSGKSTLAREIAERAGCPTLDLDTLYWEPHAAAVPRPLAAAVADLRAFCEAHASWVIEGCYESLIEAALRYRPQLLFLDPGVERCMANCASRPWEPHKYPSKAAQDAMLAPLLEWVRGYYTREGELSYASHRALFEAYDGPRQRLDDQHARRAAVAERVAPP